MEHWFNIQTLIWLFPVIFILHDFEEIILMEKFMKENSNTIYEKLPKKMADRIIKQFSMSTAQFSVAVLVIFLFVSSSTYMASQYYNQSPFGNIYFFTIVMLVFFLHSFTHLGQSIFLRSITPGVVTSIVIVIPYCIVLFHSLFVNGLINWISLYICLPFILLIFPVIFMAHWIGKKVI